MLTINEYVLSVDSLGEGLHSLGALFFVFVLPLSTVMIA